MSIMFSLLISTENKSTKILKNSSDQRKHDYKCCIVQTIDANMPYQFYKATICQTSDT